MRHAIDSLTAANQARQGESRLVAALVLAASRLTKLLVLRRVDAEYVPQADI